MLGLEFRRQNLSAGSGLRGFVDGQGLGRIQTALVLFERGLLGAMMRCRGCVLDGVILVEIFSAWLDARELVNGQSLSRVGTGTTAAGVCSARRMR